MRFPPVKISFPPGWLVLTSSGDSSGVPSEVAHQLDEILRRQPNTCVVAWFALPLESEQGQAVGGVVACAVGAWVEGRVVAPGPMREKVRAAAAESRSSLEQSVDIGGVDSVWLQVTYDFPDLHPGATFLLTFATPNLPLSHAMTDFFDGIAAEVVVENDDAMVASVSK